MPFLNCIYLVSLDLKTVLDDMEAEGNAKGLCGMDGCLSDGDEEGSWEERGVHGKGGLASCGRGSGHEGAGSRDGGSRPVQMSSGMHDWALWSMILTAAIHAPG